MSVESVVLAAAGDIRIEFRPEVAPGDGDVVIAPAAVGICGSDLHLYRHGRIGTSIVERPLVLGHESAGVVLDVGRAVLGLTRGDRVVVEPGISCGVCDWCVAGTYNLCPRVRFLGIPPSDGAMARRITVPSRFVHRMADSMSWAEGAMIEPFAIGLQAVRSAGIRPGDTVLVAGAGPIGLMVLQAARISGATKVISVDIAPRPRAMALALGAFAVVDGTQGLPFIIDEVKNLTEGKGVDHAIEAVGAAATVNLCIESVRRGGTVTLVGIAEAPGISLDTIKIVRTGLTVRSSFRYAHVHAQAIEYVAQGRADLHALVTHRFPIYDAARAFQACVDREVGVVKAILTLD